MNFELSFFKIDRCYRQYHALANSQMGDQFTESWPGRGEIGYKPSSSALNDIKNKRAQNKHPTDMKYSNIFNLGNIKFRPVTR